jgi:hypothetical protein
MKRRLINQSIYLLANLSLIVWYVLFLGPAINRLTGISAERYFWTIFFCFGFGGSVVLALLGFQTGKTILKRAALCFSVFIGLFYADMIALLAINEKDGWIALWSLFAYALFYIVVKERDQVKITLLRLKKKFMRQK